MAACICFASHVGLVVLDLASKPYIYCSYMSEHTAKWPFKIYFMYLMCLIINSLLFTQLLWHTYRPIASKFRLVRPGNRCGLWLIVTVTITIFLVYTLFATLILHLQCKENSTFYIIACEPVS